MRALPFLGALFATVFLQSTVRGQELARTSVTDSPKGFDRQYRQVFQASMKKDERLLRVKLEGFALPSGWFTEVFGPDEGPEMAKLYSAQFRAFELSTVRRLASIRRCRRCLISMQTKPAYSTEVNVFSKSGEPGAASPVFHLPPVERFQVHYVDLELEDDQDATGQNFTREIPMGNGSWMDSFVYVDGAFRFFGKGAYSFWEPGVRLADPCSESGHQSGGHLIHEVDPIYPEEARNERITGVVDFLVTVGEDGSVRSPEVIDGDKTLVQAAKEAVLQWRYEPFVQCGKAVEMRSPARVKFPPP